MIKDFRLIMGDEELRLRMNSTLKKAIRDESRRRTDKEGALVSMTTLMKEVLIDKFNTDEDNLKKAIRDESRRKTDKEGALVSMNSIVIETLNEYFLKEDMNNE